MIYNADVPVITDENGNTYKGIVSDPRKYVVYKASDMKPTYAADKSDALIAYKITGEKFVSIGNERVATVELICVKA